MGVPVVKSLSGDFGVNGINPLLFEQEVRASIADVEWVTVVADDVTTSFADALTGPEDTTFDGLVAAHDGAEVQPFVTDPAGDDQLVNLKTASFGSALFDNGTKNGVFNIDWNNGQNQKVLIDGAALPTFTDPPGVGHFSLLVIQDPTGGRTWKHPTGVGAGDGGAEPAFSEVADEETHFAYHFRGSAIYIVGSLSNVKAIP